MGHDATDIGLQCHWRHFVSAYGMDGCDDEQVASARITGSVSKRRDRKPWETGDRETGAQVPVVDGELRREACGRRGLGDRLLRWYLRHGEALYAA